MFTQQLKFFILLLVLFSKVSFADSLIIHTNTSSIKKIGDAILILEDKTNQLSVSEVLTSNQFKPSIAPVPSLKVSSSSFWIKFKINNRSDKAELLVELAQPTIDEVEFYTILPGNKIVVVKVGEYLPFSNRKYQHPNYLFDINIAKNDTGTYLMKIKSREQIQVPLSIGVSDLILETYLIRELVSGIYFGIIAVMFLYNLFIYFTVRNKGYLYYVVYIILVGLTMTTLQGYAFKYFWPNTPWLATYSLFLFPPLSGIAGLVFVKVFLCTKENFPSYNKGAGFLIINYLISIILAFAGFFDVSYSIIGINAMLVSLYLLYVGYGIFKKGHRPAKFFLLAWSIFLVGICLFVLKDLDILPYNDLTTNTMSIGSTIEVVLLSFGLADHINILKKEKEASQQQALEALEENKRVVEQQNTMLEKNVKERTAALEASNQELNETFKNLKDAQAQLVSSEKMASLGQLSAGIAHEINNPINFVMSNVNPLKRDISEIFELLEKYDELKDENDLKVKLGKILKLRKDMDMDFLVKEVELLLNGIHEGALRTSEIVKGMSTFSGNDDTGYKNANIHKCIDSTLIVLNSVIKGNIAVVKKYDELPLIECNPGKLNQVFLNLLNNAAQSIKSEKNVNKKGIIRIQTQLLDNYIEIKISDNGAGIPEGYLTKIFDPFFTTKAVGEGTGLGLSIVNNIIKGHNGTISASSVKGEGAEFTIMLPLVAGL